MSPAQIPSVVDVVLVVVSPSASDVLVGIVEMVVLDVVLLAVSVDDVVVEELVVLVVDGTVVVVVVGLEVGHRRSPGWPTASRSVARPSVADTAPLPFTSQRQSAQSRTPTLA